MFDFVFRLTGHSPVRIYDRVARIVNDRGFSASEIILQRKARTAIFEDSLHEFGVLLILCFDFCHIAMIMCLSAKLMRYPLMQKSPYTLINKRIVQIVY